MFLTMRAVSSVCLVFCLLSLVQVFERRTASPYYLLYPAWSLASAVMYAGMSYGIQKKSSFTWKLGWIALAAAFLQFLSVVLRVSLNARETPERWILSAALLLGSSCVAFYWALWWARRREYFDDQTHEER